MKHASLKWFLLAYFIVAASSACAAGYIEGSAKLTLDEGRTVCGEWLRVLLVRSACDIPEFVDQDKITSLRRMELVRDLHMKFFINARKKLTQPDYVVKSVLTSSEGIFKFTGIAPGTYYILVTFPAMIKDYKVAWQIPVTVKDNETTTIELNNDNLAIPTYSRNHTPF